MTLLSSLHVSFSGLKNTEQQLNTVSSNINNADKPGYSKKYYETTYVTTPYGSIPHSGEIAAKQNAFLVSKLVRDLTAAGADYILSKYLNDYSSFLGEVGADTSVSAAIDDLFAGFDALATSPDNSSAKTQVVSDAQNLAVRINTLSDQIQSLRGRADQDIETTVDDINILLNRINDLNDDIFYSNATGLSAPDLEDERLVALEELAAKMNISYFFTDNNRLKIYTSNGQPLLDSQVHELSYSATSNVNSLSVFAPITLNGLDITNNIRSGELSALVELRDVTLVQEHDKLQELATQIINQTNAIVNNGASLPPRRTLTGSEIVTAGDAFPAVAGSQIRIAITDQVGVVQSVVDFPIDVYATVGDLITGLNTLPGINATINANGFLEITSTAPNTGVSINSLNSDIGADNRGFSHYFGLNNLFDGTDAESIDVAAYLKTSPQSLAAGSLLTSALAVGDTGIAIADGSTARAAADVLMSGTTSFSAAGNFVSQTTSISKYANNFISDGASRAAQSEREYNITRLLEQQSKEALANDVGVNLDEETARMLQLQSNYEAVATLISTIRQLFEDLISAVR